MDITEEIREFWEWCGIEIDEEYSYAFQKKVYLTKDSHGIVISLPPITLNNLFKYAVPKLDGCHIDMIKERKYSKTELFFATAWIKGSTHSCADDKDPAVALFGAIQKVQKGEKQNETD